ncbi:helix-turn-helix domain-containing protein [Streptomyces lincolnensis]|uniref:helix-turn-helix domain-containing protein n=1 Tax=Streptomyces lincolnensis TaxID=1915 RepID=UPI001E58CD23|nr:helix-turn-helix domain-containing protein [Streptomyces lincolnensis]MCD7437374.1 helix-turn-helix domain-containing protein [Streptomyces lincolnensis]
MRSTVHERGTAAAWDVVRPPGPSRLAGVSMAGFRAASTAGRVDVRVVPHPAVTVVLEFGAGPLVVDTANGHRQRGDLVAGFLHGSLRVRGESVECVQVRLSPVVAHTVLDASPAELDHTVVGLEDLWGRDAARLRQRLGETTSWQDRFALAEALLTRRAESGPPVDRQVAWAWHRITAGRGRVRIEELAAELGWSRTRLWSRFRSQIGLPPKRAAKLVRFDHAAHRLATGESPARVAADSGYVDQSHLHRDVLAFTGATPATVAGGQWLAVDAMAWD